MKLSIPTVLLDKYRVEQEIGQGGMGHVYAARHLTMDRQVAIKVLRSELSGDPSLVERFSREVVATARISNPYVVSVYDVDRMADGTLFIVMDLLRGDTLRQRMDLGLIPLQECIDIMVETAAAVSAAHRAGVVHRDLKPENIFLTVDPAPQVKVVDFGIAKLDGVTSITALNAMMGTPAYMAPEQLVSLRNTGPRSDLWSLGVVAFELLAGRPPFNGDSLPGLCAAILNGEPPVFDSPRELEEGLRTAVLRCLEPEPERRHQSVAAFALAIAHYGSSRAERALATISLAAATSDAATSDAATLPSRLHSEPRVSPDGPMQAIAWSHTPTQNAGIEAQGSVHVARAPYSRMRWAGFGIGAALILAAGAWHMRDAPARHTTRGAAAASLSWLSRKADNALPMRPNSGPMRQPKLRFQAEATGHSIQGVGFSVDGQVISTFSSESGRVRLFSRDSGTEVRTLPTEGVERAFFGTNDYALTKTATGVLTQWSLMNGVSVGTTKLERAIAFGGSNPLDVVVVTADRQVISMAELGRKRAVISLPLDPSGVLAVRSDGRRAVVGTLSSMFLVVDLARREVIKLASPSDSALSAAMFFANRSGVITGDNEGRTMLWLPPGQLPVKVLPRSNGSILAISASGDEQQVLVASPRQLMLYEPETGRSKVLPLAGAAMSTARLSLDGTQIAVGNEQGEVLVFPVSAFE